MTARSSNVSPPVFVRDDVEDLGLLVAIEVGHVHRDRLAGQRQRRRERQPALVENAAADLLFLLREDVNLVLAAGSCGIEADGPCVAQAGERLSGARGPSVRSEGRPRPAHWPGRSR